MSRVLLFLFWKLDTYFLGGGDCRYRFKGFAFYQHDFPQIHTTFLENSLSFDHLNLQSSEAFLVSSRLWKQWPRTSVSVNVHACTYFHCVMFKSSTVSLLQDVILLQLVITASSCTDAGAELRERKKWDRFYCRGWWSVSNLTRGPNCRIVLTNYTTA